MGTSSDNLIPEDLFESGFWDDVVAKTGQVADDRVRRLADVKADVEVTAPESVDVTGVSLRGRPKSPSDMSIDELRGLIEKHGSRGNLARAAMICRSTLRRCLTGERSLTAVTAWKIRAATLRLIEATAPAVVAAPVRQAPRYATAHALKTNSCKAAKYGCAFTTNGNSIGRHQQWCPLHLAAHIYETGGEIPRTVDEFLLDVELVRKEKPPKTLREKIVRRFRSYTAMISMVISKAKAKNYQPPTRPTKDQLFSARSVAVAGDVTCGDDLVSWNAAAVDILGWIFTGEAKYRYVEELGEMSLERAMATKSRIAMPRVTRPRVTRPHVVKECVGCGKTAPHNTYIEARGGGVERVMGRCTDCCRGRRRKAERDRKASKQLQSESA